MAERQLPPPITTGDAYLRELLDEVRGLRSDVQALRPAMPPASPAGEVELREPKPASRSRRSKKQE